MKVTILVGYEKINERLYNTGRALQDRGFSVNTILWRRGTVDERQRTRQEDESLGAEYIGADAHESTLSLFRNFLEFHKVAAKRLRGIRPDVVHVGHLILLPLAIYIKLRIGCKVIYDAYEFHAFSIAERLRKGLTFPLAKAFVYALEGLLIRCCDGVLTIDSSHGCLKQRYLKHNRNVTVLYNVPPQHVAIDENLLESLRKKYKGIPVIIYVGGITKEKGSHNMVEVLSAVRNIAGNARLVIIGRFRGGQREDFLALAKRYGVGDAIDLVDWLPFRQMCAYLAVANVGIALYEDTPRFQLLGGGNGRKLFMYMYFGVPIVISNHGEVGRIVAEEGCGILTCTTDRENMALSISQLLKDAQLRERMGEAGRRAIFNRYNWDAEKEKMLGMYQRLLGVSWNVRP